MMTFLRQWILSVTCGAMVVALANHLTPQGSTKKMVQLIGGLVLLITVVNPLIELDYTALAGAAAWDMVSVETGALQETNQDLLKRIIGEKVGAYILDKANTLGVACERVTVTCQEGEGEIYYPAAVTIRGIWSESQQDALSQMIEADLAIPIQEQTYETGGETS